MIRESILPGGVRLLTETMPHVRSATLGIFAEVGSSEEPRERRGISHLLEHMLFKGTRRRSARRIAEEMDAVGGNLNAATDKELTVFYAHVMDKHLPVAVDVLADMFLHSQLDAEELRKERDVVLEEIKMYDDSPDEVISDVFTRTLWHGANLGDPTIGFAHTVAAIDRETLAAWHRERYGPGTVMIAAAGNLDHDELAARLGDVFDAFSGTALPPEPEAPAFHSAVTITHDDTEQAYVMLGMPGLSRSPRRARPRLRSFFVPAIVSQRRSVRRERRHLARSRARVRRRDRR
jgi:predicted Zn-dependent peptidase